MYFEKERKNRKNLLILILSVISIILAGCGEASEKPMDYSIEGNWAYNGYLDALSETHSDEMQPDDTESEETKADVFFVTPVAVMGDENTMNMDVTDVRSVTSFLNAINMEKGIYDKNNRFYAPYYRQATFAAYGYSEEYREQFLEKAFADVKASFEYYLENYNEGRPIILAGFSQGGDHVKRLLEEYGDKENVKNKLVAAYVIGWNVTDDDLTNYPHLKMAQAETDTGVIVSFCTEAENITKTIIVPQSTNGINPLNWKTDDTPAENKLNLGACFMNGDIVMSEVPEFTGAYIDPERGTLKVTDVSREDYPALLPGFIEGNYHIYDYQFFYRNLEKNVKVRTDEYYAEQKIKARNFGEEVAGISFLKYINHETVENDSMYYADDVSFDMLNASYWLEGKDRADEIIMSQDEIAQFNEDRIPKNDKAANYYSYIGDNRRTSVSKEELKAIVTEVTLPKQNIFRLNGEAVLPEDEFWTELIELRDVDGIKDANDVLYGVTTEDAYVRMAPTSEEFSSGWPYDYCDGLQNSSLRINEPVIVLKKSADGKFYYVLSSFCGGWVETDKLGITDNYDYWYDKTHPDDFVVITENHAYLDTDAEDEQLSAKEVSMGEKFGVCKSEKPVFSRENRLAINNYMIEIPCRSASGMLVYKTARMPGYISVNRGYLEYNQRNLLELAFKCLGERYGWGGQYGARDCSAYIMDIYRCFGIMLPRNTSGMMGIKDTSLYVAGMSDEEKMELLESLPSGAILLFPGHAMMYLGCRDNKYYCISAVGSMRMNDYENVVRVSSVLVNTLDTKRGNGNSWLQSLNYFKVIMR